jgi:cytochrome c peroxidase
LDPTESENLAEITAVLSLGLLVPAAQVAAAELSPIEALGKAIFFDEGVSLRGNQACATCRVPAAGWVGNDSAINAAGAIYE